MLKQTKELSKVLPVCCDSRPFSAVQCSIMEYSREQNVASLPARSFIFKFGGKMIFYHFFVECKQ